VTPEIWILRHGIEATEPDQPGLSRLGTARMRRIIQGLIWMGVRFDHILCADEPASRETALLLAGASEPPQTCIETAALGPAGTVDAALQEIQNTPLGQSLAVVGCEPLVGLLAGRLIGSSRPLVFKKGGACRIDFDPGSPHGRLRWLLPPKVLRELGR
jgi:phosphohistidine phosphatase